MSESPTEDELFRAVSALIPFIRRWQLSLNPEDAEEVAQAVLLHGRSDTPPDQIAIAVEHQIDQHEERARRLAEAMRAVNDQRDPPGRAPPADGSVTAP
ncbi:hypothetical protein DMB66_31260 [Actinoplanes sp. ATCC 53533]|uniref:hypothetical protein n=1 Tax=Actinoplanes sp. ATCC 53533 TaxID=1288362 RepID=UPI000F77CD16|nr:hypothetical protein [Actinoplanes sp. ATCC 53533]RSM57982.1 hypothetical protein DMB66_31260 [Actinoplanes sp. ATCC 53533]